jgi:hypothetical protein
MLSKLSQIRDVFAVLLCILGYEACVLPLCIFRLGHTPTPLDGIVVPGVEEAEFVVDWRQIQQIEFTDLTLRSDVVDQ